MPSINAPFLVGKSFLACLTLLALAACAPTSISKATSTTEERVLTTTTSLFVEVEPTTTPDAATTTTTESTTTSTALPEGVYPDSWADALVEAANRDDFGMLAAYTFATDQKRDLFRVFVESDMPNLEVGSCEGTYYYPGCSIGSDDGQAYSVEFDLDSVGGEFSDLLVRAVNIDYLASDGAYGSGCSPGPGSLPDGIWFGYIAARRSNAIDFDLACLIPNELVDVEMVNTSTAVRTLAVASDMLVTQQIMSESEPFAGTLYRDWGDEWCPMTGTCPVWIRIDGGRLIYIAEEFYA